jgi:hypothetical protein
MLLTMHARTGAIRALTLEAAYQLDLADHAAADAERARARGLAQWLLPICKACGSDTGFDVANLAVQVYGGHGYVTDSGVEQYVRDVRIAGIYEGTNGIQAIDLAMRKLAGDGGERAREWLERMRADVAGARGEAVDGLRAPVLASIETLASVSAELLARSATGEHASVEGGAVAYLRLAGLVGGAWMWVRMAMAASGDVPLARFQRRVAAFYVHNLLPESTHLATQALAGGAFARGPEVDEWLAGV